VGKNLLPSSQQLKAFALSYRWIQGNGWGFALVYLKVLISSCVSSPLMGPFCGLLLYTQSLFEENTVSKSLLNATLTLSL